jgi:hypothetical protein
MIAAAAFICCENLHSECEHGDRLSHTAIRVAEQGKSSMQQ